MPIVVFAGFAVVMQALNLALCIAIEQYISSAASVTAFALLYFGAFGLAWKLTVWAIDKHWGMGRATSKQQVVGVLITMAQFPVFA
jgi:hypothetical protein